MEKNSIKNILGFVLLTPAVISVILFLLQLVGVETLKDFLGTSWTGDWNARDSGGGGYSSSLPIYFGLMAIAGVYLLKDHKV